MDGVNAAEVTKKVKAHASDPTADLPPAPALPKEDLNTKLKRLINTRKCMLFMKGHPDEPKCGFSKQFVALMKDLNADYGSFDILTDDEVSKKYHLEKINIYYLLYLLMMSGASRTEDLQQLANLPPAVY